MENEPARFEIWSQMERSIVFEEKARGLGGSQRIIDWAEPMAKSSMEPREGKQEKKGHSHNFFDFPLWCRPSVRIVTIPDRPVAKSEGDPDRSLGFSERERIQGHLEEL